MALNGYSSTQNTDVPSVEETTHAYITDAKSQFGRLTDDAEVVKQIVKGTLTEGVLDDRESVVNPPVQSHH